MRGWDYQSTYLSTCLPKICDKNCKKKNSNCYKNQVETNSNLDRTQIVREPKLLQISNCKRKEKNYKKNILQTTKSDKTNNMTKHKLRKKIILWQN